MGKANGSEGAFIAMSVALGATIDEALASLDAGAFARAQDAASSLAHPAREVRVKALAAGLARIALAIEAARLA
jgi:hypothetical protein